MAAIRLHDGTYVTVDDNDYDRLSQYTWYADKNGYAVTVIDGQYRSMATMVIDVPDGMLADHINLNHRDNSKHNLRVATKSQNAANSRKHADGSSRYKGVCATQYTGRWVASICCNRKRTYLGTFANEEDAARAYDAAAIVAFGDFARLNFPKDKEVTTWKSSI